LAYSLQETFVADGLLGAAPLLFSAGTTLVFAFHWSREFTERGARFSNTE